jgi:hypothetical protein
MAQRLFKMINQIPDRYNSTHSEQPLATEPLSPQRLPTKAAKLPEINHAILQALAKYTTAIPPSLYQMKSFAKFVEPRSNEIIAERPNYANNAIALITTDCLIIHDFNCFKLSNCRKRESLQYTDKEQQTHHLEQSGLSFQLINAFWQVDSFMRKLTKHDANATPNDIRLSFLLCLDDSAQIQAAETADLCLVIFRAANYVRGKHLRLQEWKISFYPQEFLTKHQQSLETFSAVLNEARLKFQLSVDKTSDPLFWHDSLADQPALVTPATYFEVLCQQQRPTKLVVNNSELLANLTAFLLKRRHTQLMFDQPSHIRNDHELGERIQFKKLHSELPTNAFNLQQSQLTKIRQAWQQALATPLTLVKTSPSQQGETLAAKFSRDIKRIINATLQQPHLANCWRTVSNKWQINICGKATSRLGQPQIEYYNPTTLLLLPAGLELIVALGPLSQAITVINLSEQPLDKDQLTTAVKQEIELMLAKLKLTNSSQLLIMFTYYQMTTQLPQVETVCIDYNSQLKQISLINLTLAPQLALETIQLNPLFNKFGISIVHIPRLDRSNQMLDPYLNLNANYQLIATIFAQPISIDQLTTSQGQVDLSTYVKPFYELSLARSFTPPSLDEPLALSLGQELFTKVCQLPEHEFEAVISNKLASLAKNPNSSEFELRAIHNPLLASLLSEVSNFL